MDWLDLLAVQGTLESLPQNHSSNASILQHSAFLTWVSFRGNKSVLKLEMKESESHSAVSNSL